MKNKNDKIKKSSLNGNLYKRDLELINMNNSKRIRVADFTKSKRILKILAKDECERVTEAVAKNPVTPVPILQYLIDNKSCFEILDAVSEHPNSDSDIIYSILEINTRKLIHINTNLKILKTTSFKSLIYRTLKFLNDKDGYNRMSIAKNPYISIRLLEFLSKDKREVVRQGVASNKNTPLYILEILSKDKNRYVRASVASNENVSLEILERLSSDNSNIVRRNVVKNKKTTLHLITKLSEDSTYSVILEIAKRKDIPISVLDKVLSKIREDDIGVVISEQGPCNIPIEVLENHIFEYDDIDELIAYNTTRPNFHEQLSKSSNINILYGLMNNISIDMKVLLKIPNIENIMSYDSRLSKDDRIKIINKTKDINILKSFVENETDKDIIEYLYNHNKLMVDNEIYDVHNLSIEMIFNARGNQDFSSLEIEDEMLLEDLRFSYGYITSIRSTLAYSNRFLPLHIIEKLSNDDDSYIRSSLAHNAKLSYNIAKKLSKDDNFYVRYKLADNIWISPEILEYLADDKNCRIREQVALNRKISIRAAKKLVKDKSSRVCIGLIRNHKNIPIEIIMELFRSKNKKVLEALHSYDV